MRRWALGGRAVVSRNDLIDRPAVRPVTSFMRAAAVFAAVALAPAIAAARQAPETFADLAERVLPAVVNISTTQVAKRDRPGGDREREDSRPDAPQVPPGSPFEDFFKDF